MGESEAPIQFIDVSDRPLPTGTPVNDRGLPIFVMTDADDLNWPRSMNPEDPERAGRALNDNFDNNDPMLFPINEDRANDLERRYRVKLNWVDIGWTVTIIGDMGRSRPTTPPRQYRWKVEKDGEPDWYRGVGLGDTYADVFQARDPALSFIAECDGAQSG